MVCFKGGWGGAGGVAGTRAERGRNHWRKRYYYSSSKSLKAIARHAKGTMESFKTTAHIANETIVESFKTTVHHAKEAIES